MTTPARSAGPGRPPPGGKRRAYKTAGLVLRSDAIGDADRIATTLTPGFGKLRLAVRGARRATSKIGGHLAMLNVANLDVAVGSTFDVITGAEAVETFSGVKADLDRLAEAYYVMELANLLLPEAAPHPDAYRLLLGALRALEAGRHPATVARAVELAMLADSGYLPELRRCLVCERDIEPERHRFAPGLGGVVCGACPVAAGAVLELSVDALKALRYFAVQPIAQATLLRLEPNVHEQLETVLGAAVRHVLERDLHAAGFVEHLRRLRERRG